MDILNDEGRQVIGNDLLGHGEADKPHHPEAYRELHRSVLEMLPSEGEVDAVGFSLGGQLLLEVAVVHPARFRRLVLGGVGDNVFRSDDPEPAARAVETGEPSEKGPAVAQALSRFAAAPGNDPTALAACLRRPRAPLEEAALSAVKSPVLVVMGERDFAGPAERLLAALPVATLVSLPGLDHFGTPKDFRFIQAAVDFLQR